MSVALLIVDMQQFIRNELRSDTEFTSYENIENMSRILVAFREKEYPIIHVRHKDPDPSAILSQDSPAYPFHGFKEVAGEPVFIKTTSSAFGCAPLVGYINESAISSVVVVGAVAGFCVNSTVRAGADLGLNMIVASDALISFEIKNKHLKSGVILEVTLALLETRFATVLDTNGILEKIGH